MTERGWNRSARLPGMLKYLEGQKCWDRQVGLFLMACCRRVEHLIAVPHLAWAIETGERYAEGLVSLSRLRKAMGSVGERAYPQAGAVWTALWYMGFNRYRYHPGRVVGLLTAEARGQRVKGKTTELEARFAGELRDLLRDIVGNPLRARPAHDPTWLTAADGAACRVASGIWEERRFADLPILADALEDAGCAEAAILDHLRGPGPHARGCWALDLLLGKG
jgi:hypothetical protein